MQSKEYIRYLNTIDLFFPCNILWLINFFKRWNFEKLIINLNKFFVIDLLSILVPIKHYVFESAHIKFPSLSKIEIPILGLTFYCFFSICSTLRAFYRISLYNNEFFESFDLSKRYLFFSPFNFIDLSKLGKEDNVGIKS